MSTLSTENTGYLQEIWRKVGGQLEENWWKTGGSGSVPLLVFLSFPSGAKVSGLCQILVVVVVAPTTTKSCSMIKARLTRIKKLKEVNKMRKLFGKRTENSLGQFVATEKSPGATNTPVGKDR